MVRFQVQVIKTKLSGLLGECREILFNIRRKRQKIQTPKSRLFYIPTSISENNIFVNKFLTLVSRLLIVTFQIIRRAALGLSSSNID